MAGGAPPIIPPPKGLPGPQQQAEAFFAIGTILHDRFGQEFVAPVYLNDQVRADGQLASVEG